MEQVETKVDVLAVTRALGIEGSRTGSRAVGHDGPERDEWEEYVEVPVTKLAAIAELIEADKEYDAADSAWGGERYERDDYGVYGSEFWRCLDCENESGAGVLNKGVTHEQGCRVAALERAIERRDAALARVGGGK